MILIVIIKRNYDNKIAVKLFWIKKILNSLLIIVITKMAI